MGVRPARHWVLEGFEYIGIDSDPARIALARAALPQGRFYVEDARCLSPGLLRGRYFFLHGVLHHLNDADCRMILNNVLETPRAKLAVIEPYFPKSRIRHPLWSMAAYLDEGKWIRTEEAWRELWQPWLRHMRKRSIWPRWPVQFIDALLLSGEDWACD